MPGNSRKPLTALPDGVPTEWRDFVRCRRDSVDIKPGELDWLPNMTALTLSFEEGTEGSVTFRLVGLGGILNIGIAVSVVDGKLVADTSNIPVPGSSADEWIDNFNADLQANGMQFSDVSVRGGKLHLSKERIATETDTVTTSVPTDGQPPLTPPPPPAHITDPIPDPVEQQSPLSQPPLSPPPPPAHVTDPIPEPVAVGATKGEKPDRSIPNPDQAQVADSRFGAHPEAIRRWSTWSRVGAATAGAFLLSVAGFFIFVDGRDESPSTTPQTGQNTESTTSGSAETTDSSAVEVSTTSSEPAEPEPIQLGLDATGDQEDGNTSEPIGPGQEIPGADITEVSHRMEADGSQTIVFNLAGDGVQFTEPGSAWYDVIVSAEDSTGGMWRANGAWFSGQYQDRGIRLGPSAPGQVALPDGVVMISFVEADSFEMNINGGGEPLELATFTATIGVSVDGETRWDSAIGAAGPP